MLETKSSNIFKDKIQLILLHLYEDKCIISMSLDIMYRCQRTVWNYDEDPEPQSQSSSETVNRHWGPNVKQLLLRNAS